MSGQLATIRPSNQQMPLGNQVRGLTFAVDLPTLGSPYTLDLTAQIQTGQIDQIQSLYLDNSAGTISCTVDNMVSGQNITIGPGQQAWLPLAAGYAPQRFAIFGNALVTLIFLNVPMPIAIWDSGLPNGWISYSVTTVNPAASTQLLPIDMARRHVLISAVGGDVWLNFLGGTAAANGADCFKLSSGSTYENFPGEPVWQAITYYSASTGVTLTALGSA
jgi:hypothetical protein